MTMPVEVLRKIEAAAKLEAEMAEQNDGHSQPRAPSRSLVDIARGLYAKIANLLGMSRNDVSTRSAGSSERPTDEG